MASYLAHRPVLLEESLRLLALRPGATIVDGTAGSGGHAEAILERTAPGGLLIGLDLDQEALEAVRLRLTRFGDAVRLVHASFRRLREVLAELDIAQVDGVILDLGLSTHQLDQAERGFRFSGPGDATPLDMRMDRAGATTAADLLARLPEKELETLFRRYGELPGARRLARAIATERERAPLCSAGDLLRVIGQAGVGRGRRHHPATLVFQALRIAVNDEIGALEEGIEASIGALGPDGRLVVLAYHSLEDRLVKNRLRDAARGCTCPPGLPVCVCGGQKRLRVLTRRPLQPGPAECRDNPRARSARLRAAERLRDAA